MYNKITSIKEDPSTFDGYYLNQNYPNPFNPSTKIEFSIPEETDISLSIYNLLGEKIAELVNDKLKAGKHNYVWHAEKYASGIYIYQLRTKNTLMTKKMLLMK